MDHTKSIVPEMKHRALLHSSWGIYIVEKVFGDIWHVPGMHGEKSIPTRLIMERHVIEDLGRIPTVDDYLRHMTAQPWMAGANKFVGKGTLVSPLPSMEEVMERLGIKND